MKFYDDHQSLVCSCDLNSNDQIFCAFITYNNMQIASYSQQIADLKNQNEQLKTKYKKSLQELMHILSINKTMKENMENCPVSQEKINELKFIVEDQNLKLEMQKIQIKELVSIKNGLDVRVTSLEILNKEAQIEKQRLKKQLAQSFRRLKAQQEIRKQMQHQQQMRGTKIKVSQQVQLLKSQNEKLSKAVFRYKGIEQQNANFAKQIQELQEIIKSMKTSQNQQREKWKIRISSLENELSNIRTSQLLKTKELQSKYAILQSQLSNYQHIEKYIEQSRRIQQDQMLFQSIQSQIEKINHNISACEHQNSDLLTKNREQQEIRLKMIAQLESQIQKQKSENEYYKQKVEKLQTKVQEIFVLQEKLKVVSAQKQQLLEKNNVLEAFMITQKHRLGYEVSEKIEEFQRNVQLLLEQDVKSIAGLGGLQQIIVLKGYVKQLSDLLWSQKKKMEKTKKKNEQLKAKVKEIEYQHTLKITQFDKKIGNYDNLIQKLYALLQEKVLEPHNMGKQRDYSNAISKYEQKMLKMSDQIIKLKRKNEALQEVNKTKAVSTVTEEEFERLNNVAANLQADLERMQMQNRQLFEENRSLIETLKQEGNEAKAIIKEKEEKISQILSKIADYQDELKLKQQKINEYIQMTKSYENETKALHDELQEHIATNNYLHNKYKDTDQLQEQVAKLEAEVKELRTSHQTVIDYESTKLLDHLQQLENKINLQTQQIDAYKQENTYIYNELQSYKQKKEALLLQHNNEVAELSTKIRQLEETRVKEMQENTKLKEQCQKLALENQTLASQIATLKQEMKSQRVSFESQISSIKAAKEEIQPEDSHHQLTHKSSKEIKQLNSKLLSLRTENLAMKNQLEEKEAAISELKHQIYTRELKMQKQKSRDNLLVGRQQTQKNSQQYQKLLLAFTLVSAQLEAIHNKEPTIEAETQTFVDCVKQETQNFVDCVIQKEEIQPPSLQRPQENITSLDYQQNQIVNKINIVPQPLNLEVHTTKSIQTVNQPVSVIDSNWKQQYQKRRERQQAENGPGSDYHASSGSFKMIKLLKQSLKSLENISPGKKGDSAKKQ